MSIKSPPGMAAISSLTAWLRVSTVGRNKPVYGRFRHASGKSRGA
ncbi:MAG: hypothetical protein WCI11_17920 [Candidatus Methylumidiphilus sp.]